MSSPSSISPVAQDRARCDLPPSVEDADVLARIAAILLRSAPTQARTGDEGASKPATEVAR